MRRNLLALCTRRLRLIVRTADGRVHPKKISRNGFLLAFQAAYESMRILGSICQAASGVGVGSFPTGSSLRILGTFKTFKRPYVTRRYVTFWVPACSGNDTTAVARQSGAQTHG